MTLQTVGSVQQLESVIKCFPQVDLPLGHYQIPGVYVRAMMIPEGTVLVGKIHNHDCISLVAKGSITVQSDDGVQTLSAGWIANTPSGVKRAGYAHEDTVFVTIHRTDKTEIAEIEDELVSETYEQFEQRLLA